MSDERCEHDRPADDCYACESERLDANAVDEINASINKLTDERDAARAERDGLLAQRNLDTGNIERMQAAGERLTVALEEAVRLLKNWLVEGRLSRLPVPMLMTDTEELIVASRALGTAFPGLPKPMDEVRDSTPKNLLDQAVSPATPSLPKESGGYCQPWCGTFNPGRGRYWQAEGDKREFCRDMCMYAGRSLRPAPGAAR
jgi:hypothetical protein